MFIITQDGKRIIDALQFSVERNLGGGRDAKFAVVGYGVRETLTPPIISLWPDEESAVQEMNRIWAAILDGQYYYETSKQI